MELFIFMIIIFAMLSLGSMAAPGYSVLPRRRIKTLKGRDDRDDDEDKPSNKRRNSRRDGKDREDEHSIHNIWVGDVITISHLNQDFVVAEHFKMSEKSWDWDEYTLEDGDEEYNLSVAERGKEIYLSHAIEDLDLSYPPPDQIEYDGKTYKLESSGRAEQSRDGSSKSQRFKYYTYMASDNSSVMIEDWEGDIEYYFGEPLSARDISILPGREE